MLNMMVRVVVLPYHHGLRRVERLRTVLCSHAKMHCTMQIHLPIFYFVNIFVNRKYLSNPNQFALILGRRMSAAAHAASPAALRRLRQLSHSYIWACLLTLITLVASSGVAPLRLFSWCIHDQHFEK